MSKSRHEASLYRNISIRSIETNNWVNFTIPFLRFEWFYNKIFTLWLNAKLQFLGLEINLQDYRAVCWDWNDFQFLSAGDSVFLMVPKVDFLSILENNDEKSSQTLVVDVSPLFVLGEKGESKAKPVTDFWIEFSNVELKQAIVNIKIFFN